MLERGIRPLRGNNPSPDAGEHKKSHYNNGEKSRKKEGRPGIIIYEISNAPGILAPQIVIKTGKI